MQTSKNIQISDIFDEIARGSSLDQSLNLIAQKAVTDLNAVACKIWVVKHGDICEQCPLASICTNRQMCLHLASTSGSSLEKEYPRIPISVLSTSSIVRGGIADAKDNSLASEKLFGVQQTEHPDTPNAYALYPLRGISGTVGLIGVFNTRQIDKSELQSLAQLSPAAVAAIRVAELQARCDSLRYQMEKSAGDSTQPSTGESDGGTAELKNQIEQLQSECDTLLTNKQQNQDQIAALQKDNLRLQEEVDSLSNELQERSRSAAERDSQFKQHSDNLQEEYTRFESIMTSYEQKIAELKSEQASIKNDLSERHNEMINLKTELEASQREFAGIQDNVTHLESQVSLLEETNAELRDYNTALVEKVETLEGSLNLAEGLCTSIEQKRAGLEAKLNDITHEADQLRLAYTDLDNQKGQFSEDTQNLQAEVQRLTEDNRKLSETNEQLNEKQQSVETQLGEFERENGELKQANAQLEEAVRQLEALIPKLEESVDNLSSRTELSERLHAKIEQRNQVLTEENRQLANKAQINTKLITNISHELRSPVNSIVGFSSLLLDDAALNLPEKHRHNLERISENSRNLSEFINKILDFSKIEAGHMDIYSEPVQLKESLARAVAVAEGLRGNRQITIQTEVQEDLPTLRTDKTKLQQILLNLLSNAVNFTDAGEIKITASSVEGNRVRISVSDTGIGIAESDLAKIFEEFRQLNNPNRQTKSGTGLGLAITRRLVTLLGGEIEIHSQPGAGSTFTVTLPIEIESSQASATEVAPQELDHQRTALIVSRDAATIYLIKKYLTEAGYSVATADDAERGLEFIVMAKPALIAFDFDSPETSTNTLKQIADSKENSKLIAFSSNVNGERQSLNKGADAFLTKPVEKAELLAVLTDKKEPAAEFVLVVDDDTDALTIVTSMLENKGYAVKTAVDGRAAMEIISHSKPSAIVLDLMLPEMDGFEVAYRLQLNPRWREIPVVLLTARDLSNEERAVLNFHSAHLLQKGNFRREDLLTEIQTAIEDRQTS